MQHFHSCKNLDCGAKALQKLISRGDGEFFPGGFRLTDQGLRFADLAAEEFIITE